MGTPVNDSIEKLPAVLQPVAELWFGKAAERGIEIPSERVDEVAKLVACSEFAGNVLLREFDHFASGVDADLEGFSTEVANSDADAAVVKSQLRRFRNRFMVQVLAREISGNVGLNETLQQLSRLADRLLDAATRYSERQLSRRFGTPRNESGDAIPIVVLGMGKLGGRELNFSSDIDLIFCFAENGTTDGDRALSAQEYFGRLSRNIIALLDEPTVDGFVFRIDTRLRPFGDSGPPVVSFAALESYLVQHGRDWERYAYVKARVVGTLPADAVVQELYDELITPFVYRRYLDYGVFESLREMQSMIAAEVRRRELEDNVKLGSGGIREAEFIVQALQLVRGGSEPELQSRELQEVLPRLVNQRGLDAAAAEKLLRGYRYLRRLENFIQAIRDAQTHDLPANEVDQARLCLAMGCKDWRSLRAELDQHRDAIAVQFANIAFRGESDVSGADSPIAALWDSGSGVGQWQSVLQQSVSEDVEALAEKITQFRGSSAVQQIDANAQQRLQLFMPALLARVFETATPLSTLSRTLAVTERILRRSAYLALLNENSLAMQRFVELCARSQYIADQIARYPLLLDELLDPRLYTDNVSKQELADELESRLETLASVDSEQIMQMIVRFQRLSMFRIAVADFNKSLPVMKVSDALTWLAEVVLEATLKVAWEDLRVRHGVPCFERDGVLHEAGFGIVAYGKLGGLELSYGSDLDIVFLHNSTGKQQLTNGERPLDNTMFFSRLVRRMVHFLTTQTSSGTLYEIDMRLRPDGGSGLLVTNTDAFERYQEENAWTWEHQALLRTRPVAGSAIVATEFERIRKDTLIGRVRREQLHDDVCSMRQRMRIELDRSSDDQFDLKHGRGGVGDIEFLVQYLVLSNAKKHPGVITWSDNIRQLDDLVEAGVLHPVAGERLQDTYKVYRMELHHRALDGKDALCDVARFCTEREFVNTIWDEWLPTVR
ncbi:MAG: bifunctional [glutamate--ammonia ligase]-adenylyl-L-tyrosine phosphorylase/[glutamate--ammonia-ligase] adenylyltransferase [Gammaproteobacteria bacterium]|nr:bifunctional [glutamate--ammonia ligase]-adenylyl-L-tyrosine phosphorylase/[glutamate--ammonia-ligase] adenylyltransferase [Gammaproteobacteria bacterium]